MRRTKGGLDTCVRNTPIVAMNGSVGRVRSGVGRTVRLCLRSGPGPYRILSKRFRLGFGVSTTAFVGCCDDVFAGTTLDQVAKVGRHRL